MQVIDHNKEKRGYVVDICEDNEEKIEITHHALKADDDAEIIVASIPVEDIKGSYKALNVFVAQHIGNDPEYVITSRAMSKVFN